MGGRGPSCPAVWEQGQAWEGPCDVPAGCCSFSLQDLGKMNQGPGSNKRQGRGRSRREAQETDIHLGAEGQEGLSRAGWVGAWAAETWAGWAPPPLR